MDFHKDSIRQKPVKAAVHCAHCGLPATHSDVLALVTPDENWFCCAGCATVYEILHGAGLAQFYQLKKEGVCLRPAEPVRESESTFDSWRSAERHHKLYLEGVHCSACLWLIEKLPEVAPSEVATANLDLGHSLLRVTLTAGGSLPKVAQLLTSWGYIPHLIQSKDQAFELEKKENRARLIDLGVAGALAGNIMLMSLPLYAGAEAEWQRLFSWVAAAMAGVSVVYSGRSFFGGIWSAIRQHRFSIDAPIMLAVLVAYFYSLYSLFSGAVADVYFDSLSSLIFLLLASRYLLTRLRQYGLGEARSFLFVESDLRFKVGEVVLLKAGQRLEVDGLVRNGKGFFDISVLTGESALVELRPGDSVYAGSVFAGPSENISEVRVEVQAVGRQTRLETILAEVREVSQRRSRREQSFDRYAKSLLGIVSVIAGATVLYFATKGEWAIGLHRALALLIVTCPCALALATPLAQALFLKKALSWGLLVRDVEALEVAEDLDVVCFDKTGTLTEGQIQVVSADVAIEEMKALRTLVHRSRHPVARAIAAHLGLGELSVVENWREIPGLGIEAQIDGHIYLLRRASLVDAKDRARDERNAVELYRDQKMIGRLFLADRMRADAAGTIRELMDSGRKCRMLSGDRLAVAMDVGSKVGLAPAEIFAECSPEKKAEIIDSMKAERKKVALIGDGINDALAMSHADVSIAVQGGVEAVQASASVAVLKPGLQSVRDFFVLAKKIRQLHRMNFVYSTLYNAGSGFLAVSGLMNPLLAAVIMPISALTVFISTFLYVRNLKGAGP